MTAGSGDVAIPLPRVLRRSAGGEGGGERPGYAAMIADLARFLDALAGAGLDEAGAGELSATLDGWTARLEDAAVAEERQLFARMPDAHGHGQVMCPAYVLDRFEGDAAQGRVRLGRYFLGGNGAAHGGAIALLFDEFLGLVANCGVATMARTAYLHIDYRAITPIDTDLTITARLVEEDGRKRIVRGALHDGDRLCVEAEGLFLTLKPGQQ